MKKVEKLQETPYLGKTLKYGLFPYGSVRIRGKYRLVYRIYEKKIILFETNLTHKATKIFELDESLFTPFNVVNGRTRRCIRTEKSKVYK